MQLAVARGKTAVGVWCGSGEVVNGRVARLAERLERDPALAGSIGVNKLSNEGFVAVVKAWVRQLQSGGEAAEDLVVWQALPDRFDRWQIQRQIVVAVRRVDVEVLGLHRGRQYDVGEQCRVGQSVFQHGQV